MKKPSKTVNKQVLTPFYLLTGQTHATGMEEDVDYDELDQERVEASAPWIRTLGRAGSMFNGSSRGQAGFTLIEMVTVILIAGLIVGTSTIAYYQTTRRTTLKTAAEIIKEDIREAYAMADSGAGVTDATGRKHRDQYRIEFHKYNDPYPPMNSYRILKRTWDNDAGAYGSWAVVPPKKSAAVKIVDNEWILPCMSDETQIELLTNMSGADGEKGITFEPKGSIVQTDAPVGDKSITLKGASDGHTITITVSMYGSVSE